MPQILAISFTSVTLKFSIQNFLKTKVLLKIFDTEFANKRSLIYSQPFCQPAKLAAEIYCMNVTKTRNGDFKILSRIEGKMSRVNKFLRKFTKFVNFKIRPYNKSLSPSLLVFNKRLEI